jgi:hypothetical protein
MPSLDKPIGKPSDEQRIPVAQNPSGNEERGNGGK